MFDSLHRYAVGATSVVVSLAFLALSLPARADSVQQVWTEGQHQVESCGPALNETFSQGTRCLLEGGLNRILEKGLHLTDRFGKKTFGEHFQLRG